MRALELVDKVGACIGRYGRFHQVERFSMYEIERVRGEKRVNVHQLDLASSNGKRLMEYAHRIMAWASVTTWGLDRLVASLL